MIWDVYEGIAVATCFYNADTKQEYCGAMTFDTVADKEKFMNEFEGNGALSPYCLSRYSISAPHNLHWLMFLAI